MQVGVVDRERTRALRRAVLRPWLTLDDELPGDAVPAAVHIGAVDDGEVIGTCFVVEQPCYWRPEELPAWRLQQMATAPERRGQGIGAAVLAAAQRTALDRGARLLWCHARDSAADFYAAHGWRVDSDVFIDADTDLPHVRMSLEPPGQVTSSVS